MSQLFDKSMQTLELNRVLELLSACAVTQEAKQAIIDASYDPQYGARPLRRYIQHTVETMLAKRILEGKVLPGQTVTVTTQNGERTVE